MILNGFRRLHLWNSVLISPLEWNYCVAGFLRNISFERDTNLETISFHRFKVTGTATDKEPKGICEAQKILTQTVVFPILSVSSSATVIQTEEETERIDKTRIEPQKTVDIQK